MLKILKQSLKNLTIRHLRLVFPQKRPEGNILNMYLPKLWFSIKLSFFGQLEEFYKNAQLEMRKNVQKSLATERNEQNTNLRALEIFFCTEFLLIWLRQIIWLQFVLVGEYNLT